MKKPPPGEHSVFSKVRRPTSDQEGLGTRERSKRYVMVLAEERAQMRAQADAEAELRLDLIDADPSTLTGPERMDRARAIAAVAEGRVA